MKYFTLQELLYSYQAEQRHIENKPTPEIVLNIKELIESLDSLREYYRKPILVSSGYRCPELNRIVGGSKTSMHLQGYAADLLPYDKNMIDFKKAVIEWSKFNKFDQIIMENAGIKQWVHFGLWNNDHLQRRMLIL